MLNSKPFLLLVLVLLSAVLYGTVLKRWFRPESIEIVVQNRRQFPGDDSVLPLISFKFQEDYRLTRVRVLSVDDLATNAGAAPLWKLEGDSASAPTNFVLYGFAVAGMETRSEAMPLESGTTYCILVEAGRRSGSAEFQVAGRGE